MDRLYIDLETVKCQDDLICKEIIQDALDNIKPSANCKSDDARAKSIAKQRAEFNVDDIISKTVFDGDYGQIITVGYAFDDEPVEAFQRDGYITEKNIIQDFFDYMAYYADKINIPVKLFNPLWIAHNKQFDFRFIYKRSVILNIDAHGIRIPVNDRHGSKYAYCTMEAWNGYGAKPGGSLDKICKLYGLEGKGNVDGSMVDGMFNDGKFEEIKSYCKLDVELLRSVYKRQQFIK